MDGSSDPNAARKAWLSILARAPHARLLALTDGLAPEGVTELRAPEIGTVMVRGRQGGTGAPFNLGELTVTRCSLRLATGEVGHGHVQGRSKPAARAAALVDALMQTGRAAELRADVLDPLLAERSEAVRDQAAKAAATKVDFFTMARGDD